MDLPIAEDTPVTEEKGEEAQCNPMIAEATKFGEKSSTGGQATVGTPQATGFVRGCTPESIS